MEVAGPCDVSCPLLQLDGLLFSLQHQWREVLIFLETTWPERLCYSWSERWLWMLWIGSQVAVMVDLPWCIFWALSPWQSRHSLCTLADPGGDEAINWILHHFAPTLRFFSSYPLRMSSKELAYDKGGPPGSQIPETFLDIFGHLILFCYCRFQICVWYPWKLGLSF